MAVRRRSSEVAPETRLYVTTPSEESLESSSVAVRVIRTLPRAESSGTDRLYVSVEGGGGEVKIKLYIPFTLITLHSRDANLIQNTTPCDNIVLFNFFDSLLVFVQPPSS